MTDEIIYGLMDVFKQADNQFLTLTEITRRMKALGFYQNVDLAEAARNLFLYYLNPPIFHKTENYRRRANWRQWRVARWLPPKTNNPQDSTVSLLQIGKEIQRTISPGGAEIKNGTIPLYGQDFDRFFASMDNEQQRRLNIDILYYADESIICNLKEDDHDNWFLKSVWLGEWYKENRIEPGDKIWLVIKSIIPLAINIYTEWERDPDTYRRYRQLQEPKSLPSIDPPIRDIIWDFFAQNQEIAHRSKIARAVISKRPNVSERSVDGCLGAYPHLFAKFQRGYWGLKEWNMEQVVIKNRPNGSDPEKITDDENLPTSTVPVDYILANIAGDDLVYKVLRNTKDSLSASQISEKISKYFGIDRSILARTSFLTVLDGRIVRLEDGTFTLHEKLEEVIDQLATKARELALSLETTNEDFLLLRNELESTAAWYKKQIEQLEEERDSAQELAQEWIEQQEETTIQWEQRAQLISSFLAEATPYIGQHNLKLIFDGLRRQSESLAKKRDSNESS